MSDINLFKNMLIIDKDEIFDIRKRAAVPIFKLEDGSRFIVLDGKKLDYGLFALWLDKRCSLPIEHWGKVKTELINPEEGFEPDNLSLRYPSEGIEHPEHKGFYYIPGYELNVINKQGTYIRLGEVEQRHPDSVEASKKHNKHYPTFRPRDNHGILITRVLHRQLAIVFKDPPVNYSKLVVDHLNNFKWDYSLDNLEWVTYTVNNQRAVETDRRKDRTLIEVLDLETGKVEGHCSITYFARSIGQHPQYIVDAKSRGGSTYKKRWVIKDTLDTRTWDEIRNSSSVKVNGVKSRDIATGKVEFYRSIIQATELTGVQQNSLRQYLGQGKEPWIIMGREWKISDDETPWAEFNEYQIEINKRGLHRKTTVYELFEHGKSLGIFYGNKPVSDLIGACKRTVINAGRDGSSINKKYRLKVLN